MMNKMAKNKNKRLSPAILQADLDAFAAVQAIGGYAPANSAYAQAKVAKQLAAIRAAQQAADRHRIYGAVRSGNSQNAPETGGVFIQGCV